jgi:hypothetical protein
MLDESFNNSEKSCLKNCANKYLQQFFIFEKNKKDLESAYGTQIFLFDKKQKDSLNKFIDVIGLNKSENSI